MKKDDKQAVEVLERLAAKLVNDRLEIMAREYAVREVLKLLKERPNA